MLPLNGNSKERMGGFLARAKAAGFDFVELRMDAGEFLIVNGRPVFDVADARMQIEAHGLSCTVHSCWGVNLADDDNRSAWETCVVGTLEAARELGALRVIVHPGFVSSSLSAEAQSHAFALERESIVRIAGRAHALDLTVVVENLNPTPDVVAERCVYPCIDPRRVIEMIEAVASPSLRMVFDVGHYHLALANGYAAPFAADAAKGLIAHVHLHDNLGRVAPREPRYEEAVQVGIGDLHLPLGFGLVPQLIASGRVPAIDDATVNYELMDERYWRDLPAQYATVAAIVAGWRALSPAATDRVPT
jgi:sugar phosphate isomerase/epimerase